MNFINKFTEKLNMDIIYRRIMPSILCMCISLMCLAGSTWAWFTSTVSVPTQSIQAANFRVTVTVEKLSDTQPNNIEPQSENIEGIPSPEISLMSLDVADDTVLPEESSALAESTEPTPTVEPSPSAEPTVSPSVSPEVSAEPTESPLPSSISGNPEASPSELPEGNLMQMDLLEGNDDIEIEANKGVHTYHVTTGEWEFTVKIDEDCSATKGYCVVTVSRGEKHDVRYILFDKTKDLVTFTVKADEEKTVEISTSWGAPVSTDAIEIINGGEEIGNFNTDTTEIDTEETPAPSESPEPTPTVEPSPSVEPTVEPSVSPSPEASTEPTESPRVSPSPDVSTEPTPTPSVETTVSPSPEGSPRVTPEPTPSTEPSTEPTVTPSIEPTVNPTVEPSPKENVEPSSEPELQSDFSEENGEDEIPRPIETPAP